MGTINSRVWVHEHLVTSADFNAMTHTPRGFLEGEDEDPIWNWEWDTGNRTVGLPLDYGLQFLQLNSLEAEDERQRGDAVLYRDRPRPRDAGQERFWNELCTTAEDEGSLIAVAPTGFGKTVAAADFIYRADRKAAVVVPKIALAEQWRDELIKHLGLAPDEVAILSGWAGVDQCPTHTHAVTIMVVNSLMDDAKVPADFAHGVGVVFFDEAHRLGARQFVKAITRFSCFYRIALSATPERRDGASKLIYQHFGAPKVVATVESMGANVHTVRFPVPHKLAALARAMGKRTPLVLNKLVKCAERNGEIVRIFLSAYDKGRNILVLSDRIEHLDTLRSMLVGRGVDGDDIGWLAGQRVVDGKRRQVSQQEIKEAKGRPCILATYGLAKEGLDLPHLDFGIDATPRADGTQALGRIRRWMEGKPTPVWVTILDVGIPIYQGYYQARVRDYMKAGASIK
jgi:superfamily II DNA or RNA helicase